MDYDSDMKLVGGVWMPKHEKHMEEWMMVSKNKKIIDGRITYQWRKQETAMTLPKNWRTAVDIGSHCGFWSMHMIKRFARLEAFEPVALHRACWEKNMAITATEGHVANLNACALGKEDDTCAMFTEVGSSGNSYPQGEGDIPIKRLDSFNLQDVDFVKVDCEGFELFALMGGEQTLLRCKPAIIVEQKPGRAPKYGLGTRDAVPYLESLGAKLRKEYSGDFFLTWD